ncbi:MAG: hypothetical protein AAFU73_13790 [Planctomycetota bacterium]
MTDGPRTLPQDRFAALVGALGLHSRTNPAFDELEALHAEPHRRYHGTAHVLALLRHLDDVRDLCAAADEVEWAIWFHDAVYFTRRSDNEERSADLSDRWLERGGAGAGLLERTRELILATRHGAEALEGDVAVLVDIDLSILGAPTETYDAYERAIREEYRWVPGPLFRRERRKVLAGFLERPTVFRTAPLRARWEERARQNLPRALATLG